LGKQAVESARLNLLSLNFRRIKWAGLSHYGINFEQQTILSLRKGVRIFIYVNGGIKVKNIFFSLNSGYLQYTRKKALRLLAIKKNEKSTMHIRIQVKESS